MTTRVKQNITRTTFGTVTSVLLLLTGTVQAQTFAPTGTTTLSLAVAPAAEISITTASTSLATTGNSFVNPYTGTTNFVFKMRTSPSSGAGTLTLKVTTDFNGTGGPSVGAPVNGDLLTYSCTAASGTACATTQSASTATQTGVATFGANAHSTSAGDAGSVAWSLTNDPVYQVGNYNATVTFTISAT